MTLAQQPGAGFEVSTAGLHGVSGQLKRCYEDVSSVAREFAGHDNAAALGDVQDAWTSFSREWAGKAAATRQVITGLADKVSSTAATYQDAEHQNGAMVQNSLGGQSR